jgi:hypothetical protein
VDCLMAADCQAPQVCVANTCVDGCTTDAQCNGGTPHCFMGGCVECVTNQQCGPGGVCQTDHTCM